MIPGLTDPSVCFVSSPAAAAGGGGGGVEFEASLIDDPEEMTDEEAVEDDELDETESDTVAIELVPLDQFIQRRDIAPKETVDAGVAQAPVGAVAPSVTVAAGGILTGNTAGVLAGADGDQTVPDVSQHRSVRDPSAGNELAEMVEQTAAQGKGEKVA